MQKNKINFILWAFYRAGQRFRNFVFRKRLGRKKWSAKLIFFIMSFFEFFESRVYLNTGEVGKFDHYVPRLLLRRWRIAESGSDKGMIFRWTKSDNSITKMAISSVAGEIDWDISKSKDLPSDFIRKKLFAELLEDKTSGVIKLINTSSSLNLTFLEESTLAIFIGHQITRIPIFHNTLLRFMSIGFSKGLISYADFGNKEVLLKKVAHNEIGINYDQLLNEAPHTSIEGGKSQRLLLSLMIASDIGEKIYRSNLHVLEVPADSTDEFVTSDNPVIFLDFERKTILPFVPWWEIGKKDFWIFMPISPKKAIFYCKSKRRNGPVEKDNTDIIQLLNFGQYFCANNVFSRDAKIIERHLNLYKGELKMKLSNEQNKNEPCGSRNFDEKEIKIVDLTKNALRIAYTTYWSGLNLLKDVINLLIDDASNCPDGNRKKYSTAYLLLINRSIQHIESIRLLNERGLYGDSFVLIRSLMSDLSMMQYLHFHPELLDLFLTEKQEDYQINKDFKKAFSENTIENDLISRGVQPFGSAFQMLSKASHASSFGSQLYGSLGEKEGQYHLNYGPKFQPEKSLMIMDLVTSSHYDLINNVLWHRYHSDEDIDTDGWNKIKENLRDLKRRVETLTEAAKETIKVLWPKIAKRMPNQKHDKE